MSIESPYGTWKSPITAEQITAKNTGFSFPSFFDKALYWMEFRPHESARTVIVQRSGEEDPKTLTPDGFSVQTKAQEYGGCCYTVGDEYLFFVNARDQRIYRQKLDQQEVVEPLSRLQEKGGLEYRYADLIYDAERNRILAVAEIHSATNPEPEAALVALSIHTGEQEIVARGADFYAYPRLSPNGQQLLWIEWNHPNMPWDQTDLWRSDLSDQGVLLDPVRLSQDNESVFQPDWSPSGDIFFVSDRNEWWNLYRYEAQGVTPVFPTDLECGLPLWQFGMTTWGFISDSTVIISACKGAEWQLVEVDIDTGDHTSATTHPISTYNHYDNLTTDSSLGQAAVIASGPTVQSQLCTLKNREIQVLASSGKIDISEQDISEGKAFCFPTTNNEQAFGYYYPPKNRDYDASGDERPPLIVLCHGGPTASTALAFNLKVQFWTTRGFAVVDVNYRGSTGYGRGYRNELKGHWGIYDVDDACAAAEYSVEKGWADPARLIIRGSSAGGYTVLSALCFRDTFSAGCSLYGIGDLNTLASDTHKFEARYTDSLIAPLDQTEIYEARSPIRHIRGFKCPTIFFQGLKDKVVPPEQAHSMVDALNEKDIPVALVTYPEESHGFRQPENVVHSFNAELAFYGKVFGFETDSIVSDLEVLNLEPI